MKRSIYFIILFFFYSSGIVLANTTQIIMQPTVPTRPYPRVPAIDRTTVMATATYDGSELAINFSASVGVATITLIDEMGGTWYQETIDTNAALSLYIPVGGLDSGNYTVVVHYDSTQLLGTIEL
jgi:hypothetical protein